MLINAKYEAWALFHEHVPEAQRKENARIQSSAKSQQFIKIIRKAPREQPFSDVSNFLIVIAIPPFRAPHPPDNIKWLKLQQILFYQNPWNPKSESPKLFQS